MRSRELSGGGLILVDPRVLSILVLNDPLGEPAGRE
jgi:hypothetical protein